MLLLKPRNRVLVRVGSLGLGFMNVAVIELNCSQCPVPTAVIGQRGVTQSVAFCQWALPRPRVPCVAFT